MSFDKEKAGMSKSETQERSRLHAKQKCVQLIVKKLTSLLEKLKIDSLLVIVAKSNVFLSLQRHL